MEHSSSTAIADYKSIFEPFRRERSAVVRESVECLIKITRNAMHPKESKYKQIKVTNKTFASKVWQFYTCQRLLLAAGWVKDKDTDGNDIIRLAYSDRLRDFLSFLVEERIMRPKDEESEHLQECILIKNEAEKSAQEKRRRIEESRELARKVREEKKDRQRLGDMIKQEMKADREYRNIRRPKTDRELLNMRESTSQPAETDD